MSPYDNDAQYWGTSVVRFWGCVPPPEREAAIAMADTWIAGAPFQIKELVRIAFFAAVFEATEQRWEQWQIQWGQITVEIEIDEVEVEVFPVLQEWISTLGNAFEDGVLVRRPAEKCLQLDFYNKPV